MFGSHQLRFVSVVLMNSVPMCHKSVSGWTYSRTVRTRVAGCHMSAVHVVVQLLSGHVAKVTARMEADPPSRHHIVAHQGLDHGIHWKVNEMYLY